MCSEESCHYILLLINNIYFATVAIIDKLSEVLLSILRFCHRLKLCFINFDSGRSNTIQRLNSFYFCFIKIKLKFETLLVTNI